VSDKVDAGESTFKEIEGYKLITFKTEPKIKQGAKSQKEFYDKIFKAIVESGKSYVEIEAPEGTNIKNARSTAKKYAPKGWKIGVRTNRLYFKKMK